MQQESQGIKSRQENRKNIWQNRWISNNDIRFIKKNAVLSEIKKKNTRKDLERRGADRGDY